MMINCISSMSTLSICLVKILIGMAGIALLTYFTVRDMRPLFYDYLEHNSAVQMEVVNYNDTVAPPSIVLEVPFIPISLTRIINCMQFNKTDDCKLFDKLSNKVDVINLTIHKEIKIAPEWQLAYQLFQKLLESDVGQDEFDLLSVNNSDWNHPIVEAVWLFFGCLRHTYDSDEWAINQTCAPEFNLDLVLLNKRTIESLYKRMTGVLCQHIIFQENTTIEYCMDVFLQQHSSIMTESFSFHLPVSNRGLKMRVSSKDRSSKVWETIIPPTKPIKFYENSVLFIRSIAKDDLDKEEYVGAEYQLQSMITEIQTNDDCYNESTLYSCVSNCVVKQITSILNCIPFTYRKKPAVANVQYLPYCNSTYYHNINQTWNELKTLCQQIACKSPCQYVSYQWYYKSKTKDKEAAYSSFTLDIKPLPSPYVLFRITERLTPEQMVANVGGVLGLYLGVSGWTLVKAVVRGIEMWKKWKRRKNALQITVVKRESGGFQHIERSDLNSSDQKLLQSQLQVAARLDVIEKKLARIDVLEQRLLQLIK